MKWILITIVFWLCLVIEVRAQTGVNATLSWQDNCQLPACKEDGFIIEMSLNKGAFKEVGKTAADTTTYVEVVPRDPAADSEGCFRVASYNTAGKSGYSNTACAIIPRPIPTDPSQLIINLQQALQGILNYKPAGK